MVSVIGLSFVVAGRRTPSDDEDARQPPAARATPKGAARGFLHNWMGHGRKSFDGMNRWLRS